MSPETRKQLEAQLAATCKGKEGATDEDVATLAAREHPTSQTGKCLSACMFETIGIVSI